MRFIEVFHNRERLREQVFTFDQHRHQRLRIDGAIFRTQVMALREIHALLLVLEALEVERDAHAKGRGTAEIAVEFETGHGRYFAYRTSIEPRPSTLPTSTSPATTGPTPAGVPLMMTWPGIRV